MNFERSVLAHKTANTNVTSMASPMPPERSQQRNLKNLSTYEIIADAGREAFKGGIAGSSSQVINVFSLMWLRTTMNYQYRHGGGLSTTLKTLFAEGGVPRFYRGLVPALVQSPLSRFGDTAANAGVLSLLDSVESTTNLPVGIKTAMCSLGAASFRLLLMPIDGKLLTCSF